MTTDTAEEVRFRTHVHHHNHHVLVAVSGRDGRGIGAARLIRHEQAHDSADVELSVDDTWQGTDVGAQLLRRLLEQAQRAGVRQVVVALPLIGAVG